MRLRMMLFKGLGIDDSGININGMHSEPKARLFTTGWAK